jgi:hypothetical protein
MADGARPKLEIVRGRRRTLPRPEDFVAGHHGVQGALFPEPKHGVLIFVYCGEVHEDEFLKTLEYARPSSVVDLRAAPRFDIGYLNRFTVFDVFEKLEINYVDIHSYAAGTSDPKRVLLNLVEVLRTVSVTRPIVFLLGAEQSSAATGNEVLRIMTDIGKEIDEVYEVPRLASI